MTKEVYQHEQWDNLNGAHVTETRFSTEQRIANTKGKVLRATKREVDDRLVDHGGRAIIESGSEEWVLLTELAAKDGQRGTVTGNKNRRSLDYMESVRLIKAHSLNMSIVEYEVTGLGKIALEQLA